MVYRAAGLTIAASQNIPGLARTPQAGPPDVTVAIGTAAPWSHSFFTPHYASDEKTPDGTAVVRIDRAREGFHVRYADGTRFWIETGGRRIWTTWDTTFEDACTYLVGPILAFLLRIRGALALHASAVQVGGAALALVGPHGSGKSTAAAALGRRGCAVLTDDVLRLTREGETWLAHPFGGMLRLWPAAEMFLFGRAGLLPRITASWEKRALPLGDHGVVPVEAPIPLGAIVFLAGGAAAAGKHHVVPIRPADALVRLAANSSAAHLLDAAQRAGEFSSLASVVRRTPCAAACDGHVDSDPDSFFDRLLKWTLAGTKVFT